MHFATSKYVVIYLRGCGQVKTADVLNSLTRQGYSWFAVFFFLDITIVHLGPRGGRCKLKLYITKYHLHQTPLTCNTTIHLLHIKTITLDIIVAKTCGMSYYMQRLNR